jgi:hypothetical protein
MHKKTRIIVRAKAAGPMLGSASSRQTTSRKAASGDEVT